MKSSGVSTDSPTYVDSKMSVNSIPELHNILEKESARTFGRKSPKTAEWVVMRLKEQKNNMTCALPILQIWTHNSKQDLITEELVNKINSLTDVEALTEINQLKVRKWYIRKKGSKQMDVELKLTTFEKAQTYELKALLDTGCTSSCISRKFVNEKQLKTEKYPVPIVCYNADGTKNKSGTISEYVEVRIQIQDHIERLHLSVTDLGDATMFLGYDWTVLHNPRIDWRQSTLEFDRCPDQCQQWKIGNDPDDDETEKGTSEIDYDLGERLIYIDLNEEYNRRQTTHI